MRMKHRVVVVLAAAVVCWASLAGAAGEYPLTVAADVQVKNDTTTITSKVTIHVDRLMEENRRVRVTDVLQHSGYQNFVNALRAIPAVGSIQLASRKVDVRYAREETTDAGARLILVGDQPLFFLGTSKPRAGYVLTIVELRLDGQGGASGQIAGAARVKPTPQGGVTLDNYAEAPVQITGRVSHP